MTTSLPIKCCNVRLIHEWLRWGYLCSMVLSWSIKGYIPWNYPKGPQGRLGLRVCKSQTWPETSILKRCFMCHDVHDVAVWSGHTPWPPLSWICFCHNWHVSLRKILEVGPFAQPPPNLTIQKEVWFLGKRTEKKVIYDISLVIYRPAFYGSLRPIPPYK